MKRFLLAASAVALTAGGFIPFGLSPAGADPATTALASGYGANVNLAGSPVVDRAGLAESALPPGGVTGPEELLLVPVAPIAVSGTAVGVAATSATSNITTTLEQVTQATPGPYNALGEGLVEGLDVLAGTPTPIPGLPDLGVSLVNADAVRGEAVGVCRNGTAVYSATSETVNLQIGGTTVIPNEPIEGLVDTLNNLLQPLSFVVDIERNEVNVTATGASVNALHVTVLGGIGGPTTPVLDLIVGHAEVAGLQCQPAAQCSDTQDNDGDGVIDANDPGCINNGVYDPNDNDERNPGTLPQTTAVGDALPRTGGDLSATAPIAIGLSVLAFAALALRRRSQS